MQFRLLHNLDESFLRISSKQLAIELHGYNVFISLLIDYDNCIELLCDMDKNLLFAIVVHAYVYPLTTLSFNKIENYFQSLFLRHELEAWITKSIIYPHFVYMPATALKIGI